MNLMKYKVFFYNTNKWKCTKRNS